jgi:RNA recognition motif-containing protein
MSKKVIVTDISDKATEKTVKDFFLFCGKIKEFELIKDESSDKQIAYVTFERDTAAKTALMLTNAVIGDSQITVKSADDKNQLDGCDDSLDGALIRTEDKPKGVIFAEILANGYTLQETIIEKGVEFDAKYGVSNALKQYLAQVQANLKGLDQKYQVSESVTTRATDLNDKFSVLEKTKYVIDQAHGKVNNFFETSAGKLIWGYIESTQKQVVHVQAMARELAENKKSDKNYNPTPSHSYSDDQDSNQQVTAQ